MTRSKKCKMGIASLNLFQHSERLLQIIYENVSSSDLRNSGRVFATTSHFSSRARAVLFSVYIMAPCHASPLLECIDNWESHRCFRPLSCRRWLGVVRVVAGSKKKGVGKTPAESVAMSGSLLFANILEIPCTRGNAHRQNIQAPGYEQTRTRHSGSTGEVTNDIMSMRLWKRER